MVNKLQDIWMKGISQDTFITTVSALNANMSIRNICPKCEGKYGSSNLKETRKENDKVLLYVFKCSCQSDLLVHNQ